MPLPSVQCEKGAACHGRWRVQTRLPGAQLMPLLARPMSNRTSLEGILLDGVQAGFRQTDGTPGPEDSMLAEMFEAVLGAIYEVGSRASTEHCTGGPSAQ